VIGLRSPGWRRFSLGAALVVALAAGCGEGSSARGDLQAELESVRRLAAAGRYLEAGNALDELRAHVVTLTREGELEDERSRSIVEAADAVEEQLFLLAASATPDRPPDEGDDDGGEKHEGDKDEDEDKGDDEKEEGDRDGGR
jgi:hypothetical protein